MTPDTPTQAAWDAYLAERLTAPNLAGGFMVMLAVMAAFVAVAAGLPS